MSAAILAHVKTLVAELRDQAKAAFGTAAQLEQQAADPAARLTEMGERRAALLHQLDTLDADMVPVREQYEALRAEHVHHIVVGEAAAKTADYYERTTLPDLERLLAAGPAPTPGPALPPAGDPPPPRDETEHVPAPDDLPFNVVDSTDAEWLTGGNPIVTQTDVTPAADIGPRHAARKTGGLKVIGRSKHTPTDDTSQEA